MKYLSILFILITQVSFAQDAEQNIKETFDTYVGLTKELNFDRAMDYVIEDLFDIVPRAQFVELFKQTFTSDEYEIEFGAFYIDDFSKSFKWKGAHYVVFTNNMTTRMKFNSTSDENDTEEDKIEMLDFVKLTFISAYGEENVNLDKKTGFFTLNMEKSVCAKSSNGISDWKFLNIEQNKKAIFEKILPKKIFKLAKH